MTHGKPDPSNTILLTPKQELLQSAIGDTEKKLEALEQALNMAAEAFGTMVEDGNLKFITSLSWFGATYDSGAVGAVFQDC